MQRIPAGKAMGTDLMLIALFFICLLGLMAGLYAGLCIDNAISKGSKRYNAFFAAKKEADVQIKPDAVHDPEKQDGVSVVTRLKEWLMHLRLPKLRIITAVKRRIQISICPLFNGVDKNKEKKGHGILNRRLPDGGSYMQHACEDTGEDLCEHVEKARGTQDEKYNSYIRSKPADASAQNPYHSED